MPGFSSALRNADKLPPIPPAAPAPGQEDISLPVVRKMTAAKCRIPASNASIIAASAPFCGANTYAAPSVP